MLCLCLRRVRTVRGRPPTSVAELCGEKAGDLVACDPRRCFFGRCFSLSAAFCQNTDKNAHPWFPVFLRPRERTDGTGWRKVSGKRSNFRKKQASRGFYEVSVWGAMGLPPVQQGYLACLRTGFPRRQARVPALAGWARPSLSGATGSRAVAARPRRERWAGRRGPRRGRTGHGSRWRWGRGRAPAPSARV